MPAASPRLIRSAWMAVPLGLAVVLLALGALFLALPRQGAEAQGLRQAERLAAELAGRLEAALQAAAVLAGGIEGSLPRRVPELLAQINRNAGRVGDVALNFSARDPTGQWIGPARGTIPPGQPFSAELRFLWSQGRLHLLDGGLPGPGGSWTVAIGIPWNELLPAGTSPAAFGLLQNGRLLGPDISSTATVTAGLGRGPISNVAAFVAIAPITGIPTRVVVDMPASAVLAEWRARNNAVLLGALALLGLLVLLWFGLAAQLRRHEAAAQARLAGQTEEQERRALQEVSRFFLGLPAAVYRGELFPDGTVLIAFMSEGVARLTGLDPAEVGTPGRWRDRLDADGQVALEEFQQRLLQTGEAVVEYAFLREDGIRVWLRDRARITGIGAHGGADVAGVISDISSERQLGESAAMSSKLATLGKMAASIAHELTQPLGAIALASETALASMPERGGASSDAARQRVTRIGQQADRAHQLINHLRAFGRAGAGPLEAVSLREALDGALLLTGPLLQIAGVELITEVSASLPRLRGRPILLEQVLVNLMVNARDAMARTPDGERRLSLRAEEVFGAGTVALTIEDSGPGFPPALLGRVFEPFFTTKPSGEGTGLGLSICHGIVTSFGGTIVAGNSAGGARFVLTFRTWDPNDREVEAAQPDWTSGT